jgi:hypothetical protein
MDSDFDQFDDLRGRGSGQTYREDLKDHVDALQFSHL